MKRYVKLLTVSAVLVGMFGGVVSARPGNAVTNGFTWQEKLWWDDATTAVKSIDGNYNIKRTIYVEAERYDDDWNRIDYAYNKIKNTSDRSGAWGSPIIEVVDKKKTDKDPEKSKHYACVEDGVEKGEVWGKITSDNYNITHTYTSKYK
jgi:hypothetical protein